MQVTLAILSTLLLSENVASFGGLDIQATTDATPGFTPPPVDPYFDYMKEKEGFFTGLWEDNTSSTFNRTEGIIRTCYLRSSRPEFVGFLRDYPDFIPGWNLETFCKEEVTYARDYDSKNTENFSLSEGLLYLKSDNFTNERTANSTYKPNTDQVYMINIPRGFTALVLFSDLSIEGPTRGICDKDFVSIYTDKEDSPTKFCSTLDQFRVYKNGPTRLTIRFKSNEDNNEGGFSAGVYLLASNPEIRRKRATENVGSNTGSDTFENFVENQAESRTPVVVDNDERIKVIDANKEISDPTVLNDEVLNCFSKIIEKGESMAKKYINSDKASEECKKMAQEYLIHGFTSPQ